MFSAEQTTSVNTALTSAASKVVDTFVSLTPTMAIVAGVGFGISIVMGLFARVSHANN